MDSFDGKNWLKTFLLILAVIGAGTLISMSISSYQKEQQQLLNVQKEFSSSASTRSTLMTDTVRDPVKQESLQSEKSVIGRWQSGDVKTDTTVSEFSVENGKKMYREYIDGKLSCSGTWSSDVADTQIQTTCVNKVKGYKDFTVTLQMQFDPTQQKLTVFDEGATSLLVRVSQ